MPGSAGGGCSQLPFPRLHRLPSEALPKHGCSCLKNRLHFWLKKKDKGPSITAAGHPGRIIGMHVLSQRHQILFLPFPVTFLTCSCGAHLWLPGIHTAWKWGVSKFKMKAFSSMVELYGTVQGPAKELRTVWSPSLCHCSPVYVLPWLFPRPLSRFLLGFYSL